MKLVIFGSRTMHPAPDEIVRAIREAGIDEKEITEVVCGMARGVDLAGLRYAAQSGIKVKKFPADWDRYGKRAGFRRNRQMAEYADRGLAFWDGESRGTAHMLAEMEAYGKPVSVADYDGV